MFACNSIYKKTLQVTPFHCTLMSFRERKRKGYRSKKRWKDASSSDLKRQSPKDVLPVDTCQFCEVADSEWKCINCKLLLCNECSFRIHSKIKSTAQHKIIEYIDIGSEDTREFIQTIDLQNMKCTVHSAQLCCMFCNDCHKPVCLDCLIETHQKHDHQKLKEVFMNKMNDIKILKKRIESHIPFFMKEENKLTLKYDEGLCKHKKSTNEIDEITNKFVCYSKELQKQLDEQWKPTEDLILKELMSVQYRKNELEKWNNELEQTLKSPCASDVLSWQCSAYKEMPDKTVQFIRLKQGEFVAGQRSGLELKDVFGFIYNLHK